MPRYLRSPFTSTSPRARSAIGRAAKAEVEPERSPDRIYEWDRYGTAQPDTYADWKSRSLERWRVNNV